MDETTEGAACGSCGERVPLSADRCPLCEELTGFGWRVRLGKKALTAIAVGLGLLWLGAYVVGGLQAARSLEETRAFLKTQGEVSPEKIEEERAAEVARAGAIKAEIEQLRARLAEQEPLRKERERLSQELKSLPTAGDVASAQRARDNEFRLLFTRRRRR